MLKQKKDAVTVDSKTFEALVRCRNELYGIYKLFGGIANIHLSTGLSFEGADWNSINNWDVNNIDDDDPEPRRGITKTNKLNLPHIANRIYSLTHRSRCALPFLHLREVRSRVETIFKRCVEYEEDEVVKGNTLFRRLADQDGGTLTEKEIAEDLQQTFGITLGTAIDYKDWILDITIDQFVEVCELIKDLLADDDN